LAAVPRDDYRRVGVAHSPKRLPEPSRSRSRSHPKSPSVCRQTVARRCIGRPDRLCGGGQSVLAETSKLAANSGPAGAASQLSRVNPSRGA
jgi:hypothetical protein